MIRLVKTPDGRTLEAQVERRADGKSYGLQLASDLSPFEVGHIYKKAPREFTTELRSGFTGNLLIRYSGLYGSLREAIEAVTLALDAHRRRNAS